MASTMIKKVLIIPIALFLLCMISHAQDSAQNDSAIGHKIARAYGFDSFDQITELKYTFNAKVDDKTINRTWVWNPKDNKVTFVEDGVSFSYLRDNISKKSDDIKELDSKFINDQYWLLFPFHLAWDAGIRIEVEDQEVSLPLGSGFTTKVKVTYPDTGGYTPGDVYELYLDEDYMLIEWIYRRGGSKTPTRVSTWEDNNQFGPITISLNHRGPDDNFKVWFTDVEVQTE